MGVEIFCAGSHPFSPPQLQPVTDKERYAKLIDRTQWWGRQMVIYGVHVHVGLDSRDKVLPVLDGLVNYFPHFQALSASSPFWGGEDTGYASHRALMFQQLPTAGLPFQFASWEDYESYVQDMFTTGVIDTLSEIRWDIRPVPHFGTIEMRICDGLATLEEVGAIAALTQCLVDEFSTTLDNGGTIPTMPPWHVQENKWRAARYGLDAIIILDAEGNEQLVTDHLARDTQPAGARRGEAGLRATNWPTSRRSSSAAPATSGSGAWPPSTAGTCAPSSWTWSSRCARARKPELRAPTHAGTGPQLQRPGLRRRASGGDGGDRHGGVRGEADAARLDPGHHQLRPEGRHHGAVVRAQRQRRHRQPDPGGAAALFGELAQPRVGRHAAAQQQLGDAVLAAGQHRLGR